MSVRRLAAALVVLGLGACSQESSPLVETPVLQRPYRPVVDIRGSNGDGSMAWVLEGTLAALREGTYRCADLGTTQRNGNVIVDRRYAVGGRTGTHVKILTLNGNLLTQSIHFTDRMGQRRVASESEDRPLVGADTVARRIFAAAAAATCPTPS